MPRSSPRWLYLNVEAVQATTLVLVFMAVGLPVWYAGDALAYILQVTKPHPPEQEIAEGEETPTDNAAERVDEVVFCKTTPVDQHYFLRVIEA